MIFQSINQFGSVSVASKRTANVRSEHSLLMVDARQGVVVGFFYFFLDLPRHTHTHTWQPISTCVVPGLLLANGA